MNFEFYNPTNEKGSCIIRTFAKLLDKDINIIKEELNNLAKKLNYDNYKEIEVFEKYLENNNYQKIDVDNEIIVKNLKLENGKYAVFCYDKNEYYHIFPVINNTVYDKNNSCFDLYVINIYKLRNNKTPKC